MKIKKIMTGIIVVLLSITTYFSSSIVYAENPEPTISKDLLFQPVENYSEVMQCRLLRGELTCEAAERFCDEQKNNFIRIGTDSSGRQFFKISEYKFLGDEVVPQTSKSVDPLVLGVYLFVINNYFESYPNIKNLLFQILRSLDYNKFCDYTSEASFGIGVDFYLDDEDIKITDGKTVMKIARPDISRSALGLELNPCTYSCKDCDGTIKPKPVGDILKEYLSKRRSDPDTLHYMSQPTCLFNIIAEPAIRAMGAVCYQIVFLHYAAANRGVDINKNYDEIECVKETVKSKFRAFIAGELENEFISPKKFEDYFCCMYQMEFSGDPEIQKEGRLMKSLLTNLDQLYGSKPTVHF